MPDWLQWISNVLPASYALEALQQVNAHPELTGVAVRDMIVVAGSALAALCLAAVTLRRRTRPPTPAAAVPAARPEPPTPGTASCPARENSLSTTGLT